MATFFALTRESSLNLFLFLKSQIQEQNLTCEDVLLGPNFDSEFLRLQNHARQFHWQKHVDEEVSSHEQTDRKILFPGHEAYPRALLEVSPVPIWLSYQGDVKNLSRVDFSVVGSRDPSPLSRNWIEMSLGSLLKNRSYVICSGGARGVDQLAHLLALQSGCPTVVVLPAGQDRFYPQNLEALRDEILDLGGGFLSEYFLKSEMRKHHFIQRNRLIAGLAPITVVVQAKLRSGTSLTATHAREMGRTVAVVPGHPQDLQYSGSNQLLFEGAQMVRDQIDLQTLHTLFGACTST